MAKTASVTGKANTMASSVVMTLAPFLSDLVSSYAAHAIRDASRGLLADYVKDWITGKIKPTQDDLQKAAERLPAAQRAQYDQRMAEFREQVQLIDASSLSDDEKRERASKLQQVYIASMQTAKKDEAFDAAPVSLTETLSSWTAEMFQQQLVWHSLLPQKEKDLYTQHEAYLAPLLAKQLQPYVEERDDQRRAPNLSQIENALKKDALKRYQLWLSKLDTTKQEELAKWASDRLLTAAIVERVLLLADVPVPKIDDFEAFLDSANLRSKHDAFMVPLDRGSREEFREFRRFLTPDTLKNQLKKDLTWSPENSRHAFIVLQAAVGTWRAFDEDRAEKILKMLELRLLDAPIPNVARPVLDADKALAIFNLIRGAIPKPKPTASEQLSKGMEMVTSVVATADAAIKKLLPYQDLDLPKMRVKGENGADADESINAYYVRLAHMPDIAERFAPNAGSDHHAIVRAFRKHAELRKLVNKQAEARDLRIRVQYANGSRTD